jgi:hypothetical protein
MKITNSRKRFCRSNSESYDVTHQQGPSSINRRSEKTRQVSVSFLHGQSNATGDGLANAARPTIENCALVVSYKASVRSDV